jgi:hypothetical protein
VILRSKLGDRTLEEVFNFATKERISLVRKEAGAPVEAFIRESFSDISEKSGLRLAFEEHKRRGGKVPEDEVFPDKIVKKLKLD